MSSLELMIIGLDSLPPEIAFGRFDPLMPTLARLRETGAYGPLRSTDPPVTIPAWITMTSGRDPGELGLFGFRNRVAGDYRPRLVDARAVRAPRIWDLAGAAGLRSAVVSVPPTYPLRPVPNAVQTSCFLTPGPDSPWIYPPTLRESFERDHGPYMVDVEGHRSGDKGRIIAEATQMTAQHFGILRQMIRETDPHFAMIVDIAPDRLHHAALASILPEHPRHDPGDPHREACREYYRRLDREITATLNLTNPQTRILVVSDHGVQPLRGAMAINEWLIEQGFLVLRGRPDRPTPLSQCDVDWAATTAWGEGGHHCRVCLNLVGREPHGRVPRERLTREIEILTEHLERMTGPAGERIENRVIRPETHYRAVNGLPPDLIVYLDDLALRSVGSVGHEGVFLQENDTGADEANHARDGIFISCGGGAVSPAGARPAHIEEVFGTALATLGLAPPPGLRTNALPE